MAGIWIIFSHHGIGSSQLQAGHVHQPHQGTGGKAPKGWGHRHGARLQFQPADVGDGGEPREDFERMARSSTLWKRRVAVMLKRRSQCQLQPLHAIGEPGESVERPLAGGQKGAAVAHGELADAFPDKGQHLVGNLKEAAVRIDRLPP